MKRRTLIRPEDVSEMTGLSISTLAWFRHSGDRGPKWAKLGRRICYDESDVISWIDEQFEKSARSS